MTFTVKDRVKETTATIGTGAYQLDGAPTGFQAFSAIGAGNTCPYLATDNVNWEIGIGTYSTAPNQLARTQILASSNGGSAVNWGSGTKEVICALPAELAVLLGQSGGPGVVSDFMRMLLAAADAASARGVLGAQVEPGAILFVGRNTPPSGWLKANGAAVSRTAYAALYQAIGTTFGAGDGATTFNLPDLRGQFLRGWDDGRGIDSGRVFGSSQSDALQNITGIAVGLWTATPPGNDTGAFARTVSGSSNRPGTLGDTTYDISFDASRIVRTATETRPSNVALLACIKY